jgi:hypothetical protein
LEVFQNSLEYGWTLERQHVQKLISIRTNKYGTTSTVKSFASAFRGNANINLSSLEEYDATESSPGW